MTTHIKIKIERFYQDESETVFALYEDSYGYVHYKNICADMEPEILPASVFYKEYKWIDRYEGEIK